MPNKVTVIDYGIGNVFSVCNALKSVGVFPELTADPFKIQNAERLILPGVGAFSKAMENLKNRFLIEPISGFISSGRPFLGICLGMQLLMETSTEFGEHAGLGHIPGEVNRIPNYSKDKLKLKVPYIGWSAIQNTKIIHEGPLAFDLTDESSRYFYFVHSYMCKPKNSAHLLSTSTYGGNDITAAIGYENILGVQFHPERSGAAGRNLLHRFSNT